MWNHSARMDQAMQAAGVADFTVGDTELPDIVAYSPRPAAGRATPQRRSWPASERGKQIFADKGCARCHAISGKASRLGPSLGPRATRPSLVELAGRMSKHGPPSGPAWRRSGSRPKGGSLAPDLANANVVRSQIGHLAAMWNHGRYMENTARRQDIPLPTLTARELADITRYLSGLGGRGPPEAVGRPAPHSFRSQRRRGAR
jgi:mono/diheme cytochrome c family protein